MSRVHLAAASCVIAPWLVLSGCGTDCNHDSVEPHYDIHVFDELSGERLCRGGGYRSFSSFEGVCTFTGRHEGSSSWVTVSREGYQTREVEVSPYDVDGCGKPLPKTVNVRLQPLS